MERLLLLAMLSVPRQAVWSSVTGCVPGAALRCATLHSLVEKSHSQHIAALETLAEPPLHRYATFPLFLYQKMSSAFSSPIARGVGLAAGGRTSSAGAWGFADCRSIQLLG